jgi:hypothetical protein
MAYPCSTGELAYMWIDALKAGTLLDQNTALDTDNNAPIGGCQISASGYQSSEV